MIFRIEDTDSNRFVPGAEEYILESFRWLGIQFDEGVSFGGNYGPYRQSERREIYKKYVQVQLDADKAYIAFDTPEELAKKREEIANFQYDASTRMQMRNSLTLPKEEVDRLIAEGTQYVVRFKIEPGEDVHVDDLIRGHVVVNSSILDDKVLYKSADELPTYHLANIVDDHLMEITEVIRGEEWLPSLPLHYLLYEAFGWQDSQPRFAHLPLLLKPVGNGKLSKRDGDKLGFPVFPLRWVNPETGESSRGYREDGYFPEAFVNLLAMLGWNPGTEQELFSLPELVQAFSLDKVGRSGAKFNPDKARWFNREYLRMRSDEQLTADFLPILKEKGIEAAPTYVQAVIALTKERATFVQDFWTIAHYLFVAPEEYVQKDVDKFYKPEIYAAALEALEASDADSLEDYVREHGMPMGKVMNCIRLGLSGAASGLGISDILHFIGMEEGRARMRRIKDRLG